MTGVSGIELGVGTGVGGGDTPGEVTGGSMIGSVAGITGVGSAGLGSSGSIGGGVTSPVGVEVGGFTDGTVPPGSDTPPAVGVVDSSVPLCLSGSKINHHPSPSAVILL